MDVYLKEVGNEKVSFRFPSLPDESIDVKNTTIYHDYSIMRRGTYSFPSGMEKKPYKWNGYFWGPKRKKLASINTEWIDPKICIKTLETWQKNGTVLNLLVSGGNINVDVTIQSFDYKPFGGYGDYSYTISFLQYKELKIYTTKELGIEKAEKKKKKTDTRSSKKTKKKSTQRTYTIKSGDTLWAIARKYYGSGTKYPKIYSANKSKLDKVARSHGYRDANGGNYIWPGTTIKIP